MKRILGTTGISVNALGFGAWQLSNVNRPDQHQAIEVIAAGLDSGAELIDTADCYCSGENEFGHNESLVNTALTQLGRKSDITIATKCGLQGPPNHWVPAGRPERIKRCCDESLERLGLESITLYQLHGPDPNVPIEDTIGAMAELQATGKVQYIGVSNFDSTQLDRALSVARIESVQNRCNPWARADLDSGLLKRCAELGITYIPWHPVGGEEGHHACASNTTLRALAEKYEASPYQLLIAWLLAQGDHVLPIPGATRISSVVDSLKADRLTLSEADVATIGALGH